MFGSERFFKVALLALAAASIGCSRSASSSGSPDDQEEHAHHTIPAHRPRSFPDAVRDLRSDFEIIGTRTSDKYEETLNQALDIAHWLPEIAADSDMPESSWNVVDRRSQKIAVVLEAMDRDVVAKIKSPKTSEWVKSFQDELAGLEEVLAKANPKWFEAAMAKDREPESPSKPSQ